MSARRADSPRVGRVECVARRVRHAPARSRARAPAAERGSGARGTGRREQRSPERRAREMGGRELRERSALGLPARRVRRMARCVRRDPARGARAPPPACGWSEGAGAATDRTREEDKRRRPRQRPCSTAAAKTTRDLRAQRAPRACRSSLCARSSLAPHEEAIEEKTRDKDDDRRRGRGAKDHHGARCPAELRW